MKLGNWWQVGKNRDREGEEMVVKKRVSTERRRVLSKDKHCDFPLLVNDREF